MTRVVKVAWKFVFFFLKINLFLKSCLALGNRFEGKMIRKLLLGRVTWNEAKTGENRHRRFSSVNA